MINMETLLLVAFLASAVIAVFSVFVYIPHVFEVETIKIVWKEVWKEKNPIVIGMFIFCFCTIFLVGIYVFM